MPSGFYRGRRKRGHGENMGIFHFRILKPL
jgi:hypothetical protein